MLNLKDAFHSLRLSENSKDNMKYYHFFASAFIFISKNAYGIKYLTINLAIIINTILECLQSRKYCEAIMDDLLLFTPLKKSHIARLEDLLKALLKNGLRFYQRNVNCLGKNYNVWAIQYL